MAQRVVLAVNRKPRVAPLWSGLIAAVILLAAMVGVVISGLPGGPGIPLPWSSTMTLHVELANADALAPHAGVDVAGVRVGDVQSVTLSGNVAVATLAIDPKYGDIHRDAVVALRPHGLFGPKYIEITPGTGSAPTLHNGDTISVRQSVQPVDLDQVLQALQAPEAKNLRTAFVELGKAAAGRGDDANHLFNAASTLTNTLQTPLRTLDSVSPNLNDMLVKNEAFNASFAQTPLDQLVASSNVTLAAFANNAAHLGSLLDHANSTLSTFDSALSGQSGNIRSILQTLPSTIDKLNTFNNVLGLFGANLTGKDTSVPNDTNVTAGIISAIENPKSAFSAYDCAVTPAAGATCPEASREYYLRVQVFNLGATSSLLGPICGGPPIAIPGQPPISLPICPKASTRSFNGSTPGADVPAGEFANLAALLRS